MFGKTLNIVLKNVGIKETGSRKIMTKSIDKNTSPTDVSLVWFRQDLRIEDNPALLAASKLGSILPIFVLDKNDSDRWAIGSASKWWLHESLEALDKRLDGNLCLASGNALEILKEVVTESGANYIFWNRCYEPFSMKRDRKIKEELRRMNKTVESFNGSLLFEPRSSVKEDGTPYKVFTPFFRKGCLDRFPCPKKPSGPIEKITYCKHRILSLSDLELKPKQKWYMSIAENWEPGEDGAHKKLRQFLKDGIKNYKFGRNFPAGKNVSRLSPHLHFGEISPNRVWHEVLDIDPKDVSLKDSDHFLSEIGWREFSYNLLYFNQRLPDENLQKKFDSFPWTNEKEFLTSWEKGETGYPIIDSGMRELWKTGYIHNRVRMVVASFLVKNLMIDWRHGQDWFWDTLVDADLANNSASWQWVAGSGADAAPFFRIFNPVTQGEKFDPEGDYIAMYLPVLSKLPKKFIHSPWLAPPEVLVEAGISLGSNYPLPIVPLKDSREKALASFNALSKDN